MDLVQTLRFCDLATLATDFSKSATVFSKSYGFSAFDEFTVMIYFHSISIIAMDKKKSALRTEGIISMDIMTLGNVTNTNMKAHLYSICDQDM